MALPQILHNMRQMIEESLASVLRERASSYGTGGIMDNATSLRFKDGYQIEPCAALAREMSRNALASIALIYGEELAEFEDTRHDVNNATLAMLNAGARGETLEAKAKHLASLAHPLNRVGVDALTKALTECRNAINAVWAALDAGDVDASHEPWEHNGELHDCPEDDTCECPSRSLFATLQAAQESAEAVLK